MTTNHIERLDPALIRPGRVDLGELLDDAVGEQAQRLFIKFYGRTAEEAEEEAHEIVERAEAAEKVAQASHTEASAAGSAQTYAASELAAEFATEPNPLLRDETLSAQQVADLGAQVAAIVDTARAQGRMVSMASLQGHFIRHGAQQSIAGIDALCKPRKQ
jgi:chaperone BCS1